MGMSMALAGYTLTVAAGQEQMIEARGSAARIISATADFRLGVDDDATVPFAGGLAFTMPDGAEFKRLRVVNPNGGPLTVSILISAGEVHDARSTFAGVMQVAVQSMPAVTFAAGQSVNIGTMPAVSISGTPAVTLSGTNTVEVGTAKGLGFNDGSDAGLTTTPGLLWSSQAGTGRRLLIAQNIGWNDARIGSTNLISSSRGLLLRPGETAMIESWFQIYGMAVSGTTTLTRSMSIY